MIVPSCSSALRLVARTVVSALRSATHRVSTGVALTTLTATVTFAATPEATPAQPLPTSGHAADAFILGWDDNGDDKVPRTEYDAVRTQRFATADQDKNGSLSADEYVHEYAVRLDQQMADEREASIKQTHTRFRALDRDHDKFVSRAEYDASGERAFTALDSDKDGRISKSDAEAPPRTRTAENDAEGDKPAKGIRPVRRQSVIAMPSTHNRDGLLKIYDTDADGVVTRQQYDAQRASVYAATDTNGDGKVDEPEYLGEFAQRLERQVALVRQAQLKQGQVRFESIDADHSNAISHDEYLTMSARMFERADTNKDGVVSRDDPPPEADRERSASTGS